MERTELNKRIISIFILIFLTFNLKIAYSFTSELSADGIYCRADGAVVSKIRNDTIVIKMLQPSVKISLKSYRGANRTVNLKCKNINPKYFEPRSKGARILWKGKNIAMLEIKLAPKGVTKVSLAHRLGNPDGFTFAIVGDPQGKLETYRMLLNKIEKSNAIFTIVLGDLAEKGTGGEYAAYLKVISDFPFPFYHIPGNHDITFGGRGRFLNLVSPADYSFEAGKFHFIMLDSSRWYLKKYKWQWLENELKNNSNCLVFMHVPPFSPAPQFDEYTLAWKKQKKRFLSLMNRYKARGVFSGHIHGFQEETRNGIPYYISGGGGARLRLFLSGGGYYHFLLVDVDKDKFRARVVKLYE